MAKVVRSFKNPESLKEPVNYEYATSIFNELNILNLRLTKESIQYDIDNMFWKGTMIYSETPPFHSETLKKYFIDNEKSSDYYLDRKWKKLSMESGLSLVNTTAYDNEIEISEDTSQYNYGTISQDYSESSINKTIEERIVKGYVKRHTHSLISTREKTNLNGANGVPVISSEGNQQSDISSGSISENSLNKVSGYKSNIWLKADNPHLTQSKDFKNFTYIDSLRYDNDFKIEFDVNKLVKDADGNFIEIHKNNTLNSDVYKRIKFLVMIYERFDNCSEKLPSERVIGTGIYTLNDRKISISGWREQKNNQTEHKMGKGIIINMPINLYNITGSKYSLNCDNEDIFKSVGLNFENDQSLDNNQVSSKKENFIDLNEQVRKHPLSIHFISMPLDKIENSVNIDSTDSELMHFLNISDDSGSLNSNLILSDINSKNSYTMGNNNSDLDDFDGFISSSNTISFINTGASSNNYKKNLYLEKKPLSERNIENFYIKTANLYNSIPFRVVYLDNDIFNYDILFVTVKFDRLNDFASLTHTFPVFKIVSENEKLWKGIPKTFKENESVWKGDTFIQIDSSDILNAYHINWIALGVDVNMDNRSISLNIKNISEKLTTDLNGNFKSQLSEIERGIKIIKINGVNLRSNNG